MSNPVYLTRPCTACRLATSFRSLLSAAAVVEQQEIILRRGLEEMQGKVEVTVRVELGRVATLAAVAEVVVTEVAEVAAGLSPASREMAEMLGKSK